MAKKDKRFAFVKEEDCTLGFSSEAKVIVDKKTGVNYLYVGSGYGGGVTPLLDRDGKPIVTTVVEWED